MATAIKVDSKRTKTTAISTIKPTARKGKTRRLARNEKQLSSDLYSMIANYPRVGKKLKGALPQVLDLARGFTTAADTRVATPAENKRRMQELQNTLRTLKQLMTVNRYQTIYSLNEAHERLAKAAGKTIRTAE